MTRALIPIRFESRWAVACIVLALGCAGAQTDDSGGPGTEQCWDSPRLEYPIEGDLALRAAALAGRYQEPLLWIDSAVWERAGGSVALSWPNPLPGENGLVIDRDLIDGAQNVSPSRIHAQITLAAGKAVSFERCAPSLLGLQLEWVPIKLELSTEDGVLDQRADLWLELPSSDLPIARGAQLWSAPGGGGRAAARFPDPVRPDARLDVKATFEDGRMFGFIERSWPDPTDPAHRERATDPILGQFPATCQDDACAAARK